MRYRNLYLAGLIFLALMLFGILMSMCSCATQVRDSSIYMTIKWWVDDAGVRHPYAVRREP